jgi:hypothetical protein
MSLIIDGFLLMVGAAVACAVLWGLGWIALIAIMFMDNARGKN